MSIKQNFATDALPDFRNLGVVARILIGVNVLAFAAVLAAAPGWGAALERFVLVAAYLEPTIAVALALLYAFSPLLAQLRYGLGVTVVVALALAVAGVLARSRSPPPPRCCCSPICGCWRAPTRRRSRRRGCRRCSRASGRTSCSTA